MSIDEELNELTLIVKANKISTLSIEQLERYSTVLCNVHAQHKFTGQQYPQVCETIRMLWLTKQAEISNKTLTELTEKTKKFTGTILGLTWVIAGLTMFMVLQNFIIVPKITIPCFKNIDTAVHNAK